MTADYTARYHPRVSMASFLVDNTFYLHTRDLVVLCGDIVEGELGAGMLVDIPGVGPLEVHTVEFVRFADGAAPASDDDSLRSLRGARGVRVHRGARYGAPGSRPLNDAVRSTHVYVGHQESS